MQSQAALGTAFKHKGVAPLVNFFLMHVLQHFVNTCKIKLQLPIKVKAQC